MAAGMLGFTLADVFDLVTSIVHGDDADPQVLPALHMLSGFGSSHTYLLFFCAFAAAQVRSMKQAKKSDVT
jgi:hypothetical protein